MSTPVRPGKAALWSPFVRAALLLAIVGGFGLGGLAFLLAALGSTPGAWWTVLTQVHGQVQIFGWAGLMVLGVGLHFLPRLRGRPLYRPEAVPLILWLLVSGLLLRLLSEIVVAAGPTAALVTLGWGGVVVSGVLELAGGTLAFWLLGRTALSGPLRQQSGFWQALPFLAVAFAGYWLSLLLNCAALVRSAWVGDLAAGRWLAQLALQAGLVLFLLPISVGMSTRLFPLYLRIRLPAVRLLLVGLGTLVGGFLLSTVGELVGWPWLLGLGLLGQALACWLWPLGLWLFVPRRPWPNPVLPIWRDPLQLHVLTAYSWLIVAGFVACWQGLVALGVPLALLPLDLLRHLLGSGFITLLILGLGVPLLTGFSRRQQRWVGWGWATLLLGNLATICRAAVVVPLPAPWPLLLPTLGGLAGVLALTAFGWNLWQALWSPRTGKA